MSSYKNIGGIGWIDLTVPEAEKVKEFYKSVVGWKDDAVSMGDYDDFNMIKPGSNEPAAGICHARGTNAGLPAQWMIYINVENLDESISSCEEMGGKILSGPKNMSGYGRMCVIRDPAGAVATLFEPE